jgi:hypothetical protein
LSAAVAGEQAQGGEKDRADSQAARERFTSVEERLARVLATIPIEIQREGLSLPSLQTSLRGRWRGNCHLGEVDAALRKLGFTGHCQWRAAIGFQAGFNSDFEAGLQHLGAGELLFLREIEEIE